jgi:hypothetical protein
MSRVPVVAAHVSIPQLARMKGVPRRTLHRTLMALWAPDVAEGRGQWLYRVKRKWWVNLSRLRVAHPAFFEQRYVDRTDFDEMLARMAQFEAQCKFLNQRVNAVSANVRELRLAQRSGPNGPPWAKSAQNL